MKIRFAMVALMLLPVGAGFALQQEKGKPVQAGAGADDPMMAKWMEFMTPGPAHQVLAHKLGKWNATVKMWMAPDEPPSESASTSEFKWILGQRYLQDTTHGTVDGMPFEGIGTTGYDNLKKKYVATWIDNLGTGLMTSEGTYDASKKTFTFHGESPDLMQGKYVKSRMIEKVVDADHWVMEMYVPAPDGKEYKSMEIHYARAK